LLAQVNELASPKHSGPEIDQAADAKAEEILQEELRRLGWGALELGGQSKGTRIRSESQHVCDRRQR